ncbi:hypothetical protein BC833DRAFT_581371 [Globomyces pollinis-pini]|nr:hypothetical protein BC833DRAFT_581371 [Globomyces pollinis-pini]
MEGVRHSVEYQSSASVRSDNDIQRATSQSIAPSDKQNSSPTVTPRRMRSEPSIYNEEHSEQSGKIPVETKSYKDESNRQYMETENRISLSNKSKDKSKVGKTRIRGRSDAVPYQKPLHNREGSADSIQVKISHPKHQRIYEPASANFRSVPYNYNTKPKSKQPKNQVKIDSPSEALPNANSDDMPSSSRTNPMDLYAAIKNSAPAQDFSIQGSSWDRKEPKSQWTPLPQNSHQNYVVNSVDREQLKGSVDLEAILPPLAPRYPPQSNQYQRENREVIKDSARELKDRDQVRDTNAREGREKEREEQRAVRDSQKFEEQRPVREHQKDKETTRDAREHQREREDSRQHPKDHNRAKSPRKSNNVESTDKEMEYAEEGRVIKPSTPPPRKSPTRKRRENNDSDSDSDRGSVTKVKSPTRLTDNDEQEGTKQKGKRNQIDVAILNSSKDVDSPISPEHSPPRYKPQKKYQQDNDQEHSDDSRTDQRARSPKKTAIDNESTREYETKSRRNKTDSIDDQNEERYSRIASHDGPKSGKKSTTDDYQDIPVDEEVEDSRRKKNIPAKFSEPASELTSLDKSVKPIPLKPEVLSAMKANEPPVTIIPGIKPLEQLPMLNSIVNFHADTNFAPQPNAIQPYNPVNTVVSQEFELQRLSAMHTLGILESADQPRLNRITQMTSRLLGRSLCVLSLVDTDRVYWKSVSCTVNGLVPIKDEARYESFCSWVVQDESSRGVTILDAKTDPRCTHMRIKPGLEFYAGVPLLVGGKYRIGALSVQGPPGSNISVIDMNILHEMAVWASGELDTISEQNKLETSEAMLKAKNQLSVIAHMSRKSDQNFESRLLEKSLGLIKDAIKASCVLLLKLNPDPKGFQSMLQAYSTSTTSQLAIGSSIFQELCSMTLKKESYNEPLLLDNLKTGPVTKDVDTYLSKKINKCLSETVYGNSGPTAILACFFEGQYRTISSLETNFMKSVIPIFSSVVEKLELSDSLNQTTSALLKNINNGIRKHAVQFGTSQGLAPVILMIEPKFPQIKGLETRSITHGSTTELDVQGTAFQKELPINGPKGQAQAQVLTKRQEVEAVMGATTEIKGDITDGHLVNDKQSVNPHITPIECFEVTNDFSQILDVLAERYNLKKPKKIGNQYHILANYGPETGTADNVATFAHELFFSLDVYNQNKRRCLKVRVGIHSDFIPVEIASDNQTMKDHTQNIVNGAYKLECQAETILVSEVFYHQTKNHCSYESGNTIVIRGQGIFSTYKLIGKSEVEETQVQPIKENGVNDKGSLILDRIPGHLPISIDTSAVASPTKSDGKVAPEIVSPSIKKKGCIMM